MRFFAHPPKQYPVQSRVAVSAHTVNLSDYRSPGRRIIPPFCCLSGSPWPGALCPHLSIRNHGRLMQPSAEGLARMLGAPLLRQRQDLLCRYVLWGIPAGR